MAKKKISQLQIDTSLNFEDLLLGTKSEKYNYKISADELLKYLKDKSLLSKLDMGKDVLFNNTTTNVFQSILQTYKVDTLTFDNYGQIKSFSEKSVKEAAWLQLLITIKFWLDDTSNSFEKTDIYIEKSVNTSFDIIDTTPINSLVDLGKFIFNEKIKM